MTTMPDLCACDPATVPEWAREQTGRIAREHPESLASWLEHVAGVETARQRTAARPPVPPAPPQDPRDFLHLARLRPGCIWSGLPFRLVSFSERTNVLVIGWAS